MNIIVLLYALAAVSSFVELIAFRLLVKRPKPDFVLFFCAALVANLGYFALSVSRTASEALLANRFVYLGGIFLPYFMLQSIASFCETKIPRWLEIILISCSIFVLLLVSTTGYSDIYYKTYALGDFYGARYIWKVYGSFHIIFPVLIYTETLISVFVVLKSIKSQKAVTLRMTVILLSALCGTILIYALERVFKIPLDFVGFSYVIFAFVHIFISARLQAYDIDYNIEAAFGHSSTNGYIVLDNKFALMNHNRRAEEYFHELKRYPRGTTEYVDGSGLDRYIIGWLKNLEEGTEFPVATEFDYSDRNYKCTASLLKGVWKINYGYMIEIVDDTGAQQYIRLLNSYNSTLEESVENAKRADEAKSRFLAQMSHEIRTPINVILGMNEMTLREAKDDSIIEYSNNIRSSGRTLLALINSILDFSKIEDGKMDIVTVDYETSEVMNELVIMASERSTEKGLKFKTEISEDIPCRMHGDDVRVRQIITNLLTNAIKYTPEGEVTLRVKELERKYDVVKLLVEVQDTGTGIREEDRERLFASFERLDEEKNRNIEGTGLGIAIVQRLLEMMGSTLQLKSTYGEGSLFYFELEQGIVDPGPMGELNSGEKKAELEMRNERYIFAPEASILIVDDNRMNLTVAKGLLKRNGVQLTLAGSGKAALELIGSNKYDIIFMDHLMPDLDGIETLKIIRKEKLLPDNTKVIVMTANAIVGAKEEYLAEGFDDYLSKPVNVHDMEDLLAKYLPDEMISYRSAQEDNEAAAGDEGDAIPDQLKKKKGTGGGSLSAIDEAAGMQYARDDAEFYKEMLELYLELEEERLNNMQNALASGNLKEYVITVHDLKSNSRLIGALNFGDMAQELENAGKKQDMEYINAHQGELLKVYKEVTEQIKVLLNQE